MEKKSNFTAFARIFGVIAVIGVLFAAIIASFNQKIPNSDKVWDPAMTVGNMEARNYFIIYSDIACPYCLAFENAIIEHEAEFEDYIAKNDILVEVRMSDFLYEYGQSNPRSSRYSAVASYCARNEGKFWDYYNHAVSTVWRDFFASDGKTGLTHLDALGIDYWEDLGREVGLGDSFVACVENGDPLAEIEDRALKSAQATGGLPYFKFNSYISSGFDLDWGWEYVLMFFDAGLKSK